MDTKKPPEYIHHVTVNFFNFECPLSSQSFHPLEAPKLEIPQLNSLKPVLFVVSILLRHFLKKRFLLSCLPLTLQHPKRHIIMPPPLNHKASLCAPSYTNPNLSYSCFAPLLNEKHSIPIRCNPAILNPQSRTHSMAPLP
jgi:hypothetical protein